MDNAPASESLRIKVPTNLFKYLAYLARTTTLGKDENEVASWALRQQLEALRHTKEYAYRFE